MGNKPLQAESAWKQDVRSRWRVLLAALWNLGIGEALIEYQQFSDGRTVLEAVRQDGTAPPALNWN